MKVLLQEILSRNEELVLTGIGMVLRIEVSTTILVPLVSLSMDLLQIGVENLSVLLPCKRGR